MPASRLSDPAKIKPSFIDVPATVQPPTVSGTVVGALTTSFASGLSNTSTAREAGASGATLQQVLCQMSQ